jgi:hypothetical protein
MYFHINKNDTACHGCTVKLCSTTERLPALVKWKVSQLHFWHYKSYAVYKHNKSTFFCKKRPSFYSFNVQIGNSLLKKQASADNIKSTFVIFCTQRTYVINLSDIISRPHTDIFLTNLSNVHTYVRIYLCIESKIFIVSYAGGEIMVNWLQVLHELGMSWNWVI